MAYSCAELLSEVARREKQAGIFPELMRIIANVAAIIVMQILEVSHHLVG